MEEKKKYPLDQLISIKQKRLEEAEKALEERRRALAEEQDKLKTLEKKRDEVKDHKNDKLSQLRKKLDEGTTTDKIQQMKQYLKVVDEKLKVEEVKVKEQEKQVEVAQKQVEAARQDLFKKQKDVEKLKIHHKEWTKEMKDLLEHEEGIETDEMGNARYIVKKTSKRHKKYD